MGLTRISLKYIFHILYEAMFLQTVVSVPLRAVKLYILTHGLIMSLFISQMFSLCRSCFSKSLSDLMKVSGSCNFKENKKKKNPVGL